MSKIRWAYGVTTVPARKADLLPRTLASLRIGGFDQPRLFIDGASPTDEDWYRRQGWGLSITARFPAVKSWGNWALSLAELMIREPRADRYAIFQDDLLCCRNLRQYLDYCQYPTKGYWNLITFQSSQRVAPVNGGWFESALCNGNDPRRLQLGRGAVGLVFDRVTAFTLIGSPRFHMRPLETEDVRHRKIDGCVVNALNGEGWREWVHSPSLLGHVGNRSTMGNPPHPAAGVSFPGESFDALTLLK